MANVGENLQQILQGSSELPESASNKAQKPLPPGVGFGWKPSDEQTKRDIAQADYRDRAIRDAVMERKLSLERARKPVAASKPVPPRPTIGGQLRSLIEGLGRGEREGVEAVGRKVKELDPLKELTKEEKDQLMGVALDVLPVGQIAKVGREAIYQVEKQFTLRNAPEELARYAKESNPALIKELDKAKEVQSKVERTRKYLEDATKAGDTKDIQYFTDELTSAEGRLMGYIERLDKLKGAAAVAATVGAGTAQANQIQEALGVKGNTGISMQSAVELKRLEEQLNPKKPKEAPPKVSEDRGLTQEKEFEKVMGKDAAARRKAKQEADRKRLMGK